MTFSLNLSCYILIYIFWHFFRKKIKTTTWNNYDLYPNSVSLIIYHTQKLMSYKTKIIMPYWRCEQTIVNNYCKILWIGFGCQPHVICYLIIQSCNNLHVVLKNQLNTVWILYFFKPKERQLHLLRLGVIHSIANGLGLLMGKNTQTFLLGTAIALLQNW